MLAWAGADASGFSTQGIWTFGGSVVEDVDDVTSEIFRGSRVEFKVGVAG